MRHRALGVPEPVIERPDLQVLLPGSGDLTDRGLGAGVRPPEPSWGTMIGDGVKHILSGPHLAIVPGVMLVLTVLALNVFGDGVRDAFDPRATVRMEH